MAISILFIARIDTPVLAPGVGRLGPVELDAASFDFRKEVLMHEAHRHVLIERFGALCLIKLYNGDSFGSRAGGAWRLLYVLITMPWLRKYRNYLEVDTMLDDTLSYTGKEEDARHFSETKQGDNNFLSRGIGGDGGKRSDEPSGLKMSGSLIRYKRAAEEENYMLRDRNAFLERQIQKLKTVIETELPHLRVKAEL